MKNPASVKCAAPECNSNAREARACTYHSSSTYRDAAWMQPIAFRVCAIDPDAEWRAAHVEVRAVSPDEARRAARVELAKERRDHWSITYVSAA